MMELVHLHKKNRLYTQRSIVRRRNTLQRLEWSDGVEIQGKYSKNHQDKNKDRERVRISLIPIQCIEKSG